MKLLHKRLADGPTPAQVAERTERLAKQIEEQASKIKITADAAMRRLEKGQLRGA